MMGGIVENKHGVKGAQRLLACQIAITLLLAIIFTLLLGLMAGESAVLGGLVSIVPNAYFARKIFRHQGARAARQIANSFYKGEASKIALSIIMFALVFKYFKIIPLVFFVVYIVAQMVMWFAPLIFVNKPDRPESD
jgi:ATP synthase protein I